MSEEDRIVWEGAHVYVYRSRLRMRGYEVRVNVPAGSYAVVAGWQREEAVAIRAAKRLDADGWQHVIGPQA